MQCGIPSNFLPFSEYKHKIIFFNYFTIEPKKPIHFLIKTTGRQNALHTLVKLIFNSSRSCRDFFKQTFVKERVCTLDMWTIFVLNSVSLNSCEFEWKVFDINKMRRIPVNKCSLAYNLLEKSRPYFTIFGKKLQ